MALRAPRKKDGTLRIWVDSVCINQTDNEEKAAQVAQTGDVYRNARCVLAWLGPETEHSAQAPDAMEQLAELSKTENYNEHMSRLRHHYTNTTFPMDSDNAGRIQEMRQSKHLIDIYGRLWFKRLWIVREAMVAKNLEMRVGPRVGLWEHFHRVVEMLWTAECQFITIGSERYETDALSHSLFLADSWDKLQRFDNRTIVYQDYTTEIYGTYCLGYKVCLRQLLILLNKFRYGQRFGQVGV